MPISVNFIECKESYYLGDIKALAITSDSKYIISGSEDRSIKVFDFTTKELFCHFENAHSGKFIKC